MKVVISPYSKVLRNGKENAKNYPYWPELVKLLKDQGIYVIQIGINGEKTISGVDEERFNNPLVELEKLVKECDTWISVDNFFQHFCYVCNKPGIVLFGRSDPNIFGHKENINLLKDRKNLRERQFNIWEEVEYSKDVFVEPSVVMDSILRGV
jgi:ADP-heptose:LPS heptosyltransferase